MSQKNDVKKVTIVEFHPTQSPLEEPSSDSSEPVDTLTVGFHPTSPGFKGQSPLEDYLNVEDLILYLVKIRKSKSSTELLVSELFELIKNKAGLQFAREDTDVIINNYVRQIMFFSERLMELSGEVKKLAKISIKK